MNKAAFDLKIQPWHIKIGNEQEFNAAVAWRKEQGMNWQFPVMCKGYYQKEAVRLTNVFYCGDVCTYIMWGTEDTPCQGHEIKLSYKVVVDSVEYTQVKTEAQLKHEQLMQKIQELQEEVKALEKML